MRQTSPKQRVCAEQYSYDGRVGAFCQSIRVRRAAEFVTNISRPQIVRRNYCAFTTGDEEPSMSNSRQLELPTKRYALVRKGAPS
jgi:hypothetical protein